MKKISFLLAFLLSFALILSGCGGAKSEAMDMAISNGAEAPQASAPVEKYDSVVNYGFLDQSEDSAVYNDDGNKIIRTAVLHIQTTEFDSAIHALGQLTSQMGGYFETAEVQGGNYYNQYASRSAYYIIRIPKENFTSFRNGAGGIGYVYSQSENTQDVGELYYDTEARLETLQTKRERLLSLLEKADKMADIVTLESELSDVQYQIEKHTATLRKYDSLIGFSTFTIHLHEVVEITEEPGVKESFGSRFMTSLKRGFREFGEGIQDFAIWIARNLIGIIIFAAIVVGVIFLGRHSIRRRRSRKDQDKT